MPCGSHQSSRQLSLDHRQTPDLSRSTTTKSRLQNWRRPNVTWRHNLHTVNKRHFIYAKFHYRQSDIHRFLFSQSRVGNRVWSRKSFQKKKRKKSVPSDTLLRCYCIVWCWWLRTRGLGLWTGQLCGLGLGLSK